MKAKDVVKRVREELRAVDEDLVRHPYFAALRAGTVSREALKAFPGHQYHMGFADTRSVAALVERFGDTSHVDFYNGLLQAMLAEREPIRALGAKLGMRVADLEAYPIRPDGFAYSAYMAWLTAYASAAETVCGLFVNLPVWGENCGQMAAALRDQYGFTSDDTRFLDSFAHIPSFEDVALAIIQDGLDAGVPDTHIIRAARLIQGYERMFWDAMLAVATE